MNLSRFDEFKHKAELQLDSSKWLLEEADKLATECTYYEKNPDEDSIDAALNRLQQLEYLERRLLWEDRVQKQLVEDYKDIM